MQYYKEEMTQDHIDLARSNGIDYQTLWKRYNYYDWSLEEATTKPLNERRVSEHKPYIDVAQVNGICRSTYLTRVDRGMPPEEASTKKVAKRGRPKGASGKNKPYTDEQLQQAISNGISRMTLNQRLKRRWDLERALTEPLSEGWVRNSGEKAQVFISNKQRAPKKKQPELKPKQRNFIDSVPIH
ncbi:hypothetical protein CN598_12730 [Bacillus wiedmannii]|nr:hypothetical protein CN598_12730 [Bacillus wiedmannii]